MRLAFVEGNGIQGWALDGASSAELDGLPTAAGASDDPPAVRHPNGVTRIDHLVVFTPDLERTTAAFEAAGIERRRVREADTGEGTLRQGFFRLGEVILEVVEHAKIPSGPASFWGITFAVEDLDATADCSASASARSATRFSPGAASPRSARTPASASRSR